MNTSYLPYVEDYHAEGGQPIYTKTEKPIYDIQKEVPTGDSKWY
jgi:hypothetical protein